MDSHEIARTLVHEMGATRAREYAERIGRNQSDIGAACKCRPTGSPASSRDSKNTSRWSRTSVT